MRMSKMNGESIGRMSKAASCRYARMSAICSSVTSLRTSSCAAKIATSVDAGLLGYHMYRCGNQFYAGDGIVKSGIEHTIETVGALAHTGMADTDRQIIRLMMEP